MSEMSSRTPDEVFAERYAIASWEFDSADQRRKNAARFARAGMPADLAAAAAAMFTSAEDHPTLTARERTNPAGGTLPIVPRLRVIVPAIEPNLLYIGRGITRGGPRPTVTSDPDGAYRVHWDSPAAHAQATRQVVDYYTARHEVVNIVAEVGRLDTWHSPFLLTAVRHTYADQSKSVTRWTCADGNAMLIGARTAIAADLNDWGVEHPWCDPRTYWPADVATLRTVAAATHAALSAGSATTTGWPRSTGVATQWADFILPSATLSSHDLGNWLYHEHNTKARPDTETFPLHEPVQDWLTAIDPFAGLNTDTISEIVGADLSSREGREEVAAVEEEVDAFLREVSSNKDVTAARLAFAATALAATNPTSLHWPVTEAWKSLPFTQQEWYLKASIFHSYTSRATRRCRDNDWLTASGLNTIRHHLAATRSFPIKGDLYGVWQDVRNGFYDGPLSDPDSDWFTLTAMWGLSYAALHGHLLFNELPPATHESNGTTPDPSTPDPASTSKAASEAEETAKRVLFTALPMSVRVLLDTSAGQEVICYYAEQASRGLVPEDRLTPVVAQMSRRVADLAKRLIATADAASTGEGR